MIDTWQIIGIVVVLVIVFIIGYYSLKESPQKLYKKARRLHREGEECYESGDFELAEEYYQKANTLRTKAKELA